MDGLRGPDHVLPALAGVKPGGAKITAGCLRAVPHAMNCRDCPTTPLGAIVRGAVAGAVGTAAMDTVRYLMYRRGGGTDSLREWEFPPVESWEQAPDPGQVAKRVAEGFTQRQIADRWARLISTLAHWGYGPMWGAVYGIMAGSLRQSRDWYGLPFGATVWASSYVLLPEARLYKPIWEYDSATLARDLSAHLAYGASTAAVFGAIARI
jgi:uncharacterized membrane protein YagU involved in acid resistance